ncbi:hypothetical protein C7E12_22560, partial [Stenotrophomonas maltophilia]
TLFATHYFELTALADEQHEGGRSGIANVHLDAVEHGEALVFMHAVRHPLLRTDRAGRRTA